MTQHAVTLEKIEEYNREHCTHFIIQHKFGKVSQYQLEQVATSHIEKDNKIEVLPTQPTNELRIDGLIRDPIIISRDMPDLINQAS